MIRIYAFGPHRRRCPLSYAALAPLFCGRIEHVDDPVAADLAVIAHPLDAMAADRPLIEEWRRRVLPIVLLSEEPFWDTIHSPDPLAPRVILETRFGAVPATQINHQTSAIFDFERIPYYLLTNGRFARAYLRLFDRNAALSPKAWGARFADAPARLSFLFERRPEVFHDVNWPDAGLIGLCAWRTRVATAADPELIGGPVERLGRSWQGGQRRQVLGDWHADKLRRLDQHAAMIGAFENTHQPVYVTEKLFDAFACGGLPLYRAGAGHAVHRFGLPERSWLNLDTDDTTRAVERIAAQSFGAEVCEAFAEAQRTLLRLFGDLEAWITERERLKKAVLRALEAALG